MASLEIANYNNGEMIISDQEGHSLRLPREKTHSLIMSARMHTTQEFVASLPRFIEDAPLLARIRRLFEHSPSSGRWGLKEKFARLKTLSPGYDACGPVEEVERTQF